MTTKHTPEPWIVNPKRGTVDDKNGEMICSVRGEGNLHPAFEGGANARLIAAAPELLKYAEQMANLAEHYEPKNGFKREEARALAAARAVIAKATGGA